MVYRIFYLTSPGASSWGDPVERLPERLFEILSYHAPSRKFFIVCHSCVCRTCRRQQKHGRQSSQPRYRTSVKQTLGFLSVEEYCFHRVTRKKWVEVVNVPLPNSCVQTSFPLARFQYVPEANPCVAQYGDTGLIIFISSSTTDAFHYLPEEVAGMGVIFSLPQRLSARKRPENEYLRILPYDWRETFAFHNSSVVQSWCQTSPAPLRTCGGDGRVRDTYTF
jgi:hypothetical protein